MSSSRSRAPSLESPRIRARSALGWSAAILREFRPTTGDVNALSLLASTGITALLGFVFWSVSTHLYAPAAVGRAAAEISAMTLLAALAKLDLAHLYPRFLPEAGIRSRRFVLLGYAGAGALGLMLAVGFVALGFGRHILSGGATGAVIFVGAVVLWVVFGIQDAVLLGLRAAVWIPIENSTFAMAKLALLFALVGAGAAGLFLGWVIPVVAGVIVINVYLFSRLIPRHEAISAGKSRLPDRRTLGRFVAGDSLASHTTVLTRSLLPVLVVDRLGAQAGAYFYIPWLIATTLPVMVWSVSTSFLVEAATDPGRTRALILRSIRLAMVVLMPCAIVLFVAAPLILEVLAPGYASHAATLLRLVAVAAVLGALSSLYTTLVRLEARRIWRLAALEIVYNLVLIGGTLLLFGPLGIEAPGVALLAAAGVSAAIVAVPTVTRWRALSQDGRS
ncbi:MAG: oligosaccharide flippase family protein [Actinomycetota bacterium]|nr:oligosaccharide flippase family protein [Actinomycetota bacterium]